MKTCSAMHTPMNDQHEDRRVAIYFAPSADSDLFRFGCACLGRDAVTGEEIPAGAFNGLPPERWRAITASPRMYGFHATLKSPFRLSTDRTRGLLIDRLEEFAAARQPFDAGLLRVARISNFV